MDMRNSPVGIFDSGVGGIAVLKDLVKALPGENFIYYGDNANAPYGELQQKRIQQLTFACVDKLIGMNVKCIVIACNTASSAAVQAVRENYHLPVVGMEPAIRPAAAALKSGKALVMATPATLKQSLYLKRVEECNVSERMIPLPCPKLVELVEKGILEGSQIEEAVSAYFAPYRLEHIDAVVLGCTHFIHIRNSIACIANAIWPGVQIIDGNEGTAHQLIRVLEKHDLKNPRSTGATVQCFTSGDPNVYLPLYQRPAAQITETADSRLSTAFLFALLKFITAKQSCSSTL